ncbi:response regulator [Roseateles sp.]|uniref:response regulator n=1 Tax=Roseateles sp. TaxID=1971397 RepID=UPI0032652831
MNELLIWILAATLVVGIVLLVWLGRRRQQRARDHAARRESHRVALEQAEHVARAQRLTAEREHANAEPVPLAGAIEAVRLAEQARGNADAGREGADISRRIAEGEAARIARDQAQHDAAEQAAQEAERAELVAQQAREQAERDTAAAAEAAAVAAAAAARQTEEAQAARAAAEARAREDAERLARETAERVERDAAEAAAEAAARQAAEAEAARLATEAREQQQREQQAREQAEREQAEREAALALEAARLAEEARERAEQEAAAAAARQAAEAEAQAQAEAARAAAATAATAATRELRADETLVLVADDSKIVRVKLSRLLASQGYRATLAESGEQALELMAAERPHLLITDVEMPGIDGFELTRVVRAAAVTAELPVVMITSSDDKQEQARAAGVTKLLGKPYSEEALIAAIEAARLAVRVPA